MRPIRDVVLDHLESSAHLAKRHVHPKLARMMDLGGMTAVFRRGEGAHLWDLEGNRFLDLLSGGGVHLVGRNHPAVACAVAEIAAMDLPNLTVVNASVLGGLVAERLLRLAGPGLGKAIFASSGSEAMDVALRFARYATRRRRFLALEGAFHGRTWGAISVNGWTEMKDGMEPLVPTCTTIPANDVPALRRELEHGDVAALVVEPIQGMTLDVLTPGYLREAQTLSHAHGTLLVADEIQTGLGRSGAWFVTTELGIRPDLLAVSKALSGGMVPVAAVLATDALYDRVYDRFKAGPFYYSTFGENNLAMAAALATLDVLEEMDAPARARALSASLRAGLEQIARSHDVVERIAGQGLMLGVFFRRSSRLSLRLEQEVLALVDSGGFGAAVNVDLYRGPRILVQVPGPGLDAIKLLPSLATSDDDVGYFLESLDALLSRYEGRARGGPAVGLGRAALSGVTRAARAPSRGRVSRPRPTGLLEHDDYGGPVEDACDVLVVGSGPGGGMIARELALAGKDVVVIEAGPVARPSDFGADFGRSVSRWFFEGGLRTPVGNALMPTLQARCLGGGSVWNSAICLRAPDSALRRFEGEHGVTGLSRAEIDREYDAVEALLGVEETRPDAQGAGSERFRSGGEALGWNVLPTRRAAPGCRGSGECFTGCRNGAKKSIDETAIPFVLSRGGRVYTSVRVDRLDVVGHRVRGAFGRVVRPTGDGPPVHVRARATVLAAGAIASPLLLRSAGIAADTAGSNLRFHPSASVTVLFGEDIGAGRGATQGYHCLDFLDEGLKLECIEASPELVALRAPALGAGLARVVRSYRASATFNLFVAGDDSVGTVRGTPPFPVLRWRLGDGDLRRVQEGLAKLVSAAFAAGAVGVATGVHGLPEILEHADDANRIRRARVEAGDYPLVSNHVFGTTAMGEDPARHVVDSLGAVHRWDGVFVCDTGVLPCTPGANPMLTIMAIARRMARTVAARA